MTYLVQFLLLILLQCPEKNVQPPVRPLILPQKRRVAFSAPDVIFAERTQVRISFVAKLCTIGPEFGGGSHLADEEGTLFDDQEGR